MITTPLKNTTPEERERAIFAVETLGMTVTEAAIYAGISRSAVHRIKHQRLDSVRQRAGDVDFIEVAEYHCPKHGKTNVSPCVACSAAAASRFTNRIPAGQIFKTSLQEACGQETEQVA